MFCVGKTGEIFEQTCEPERLVVHCCEVLGPGDDPILCRLDPGEKPVHRRPQLVSKICDGLLADLFFVLERRRKPVQRQSDGTDLGISGGIDARLEIAFSDPVGCQADAPQRTGECLRKHEGEEQGSDHGDSAGHDMKEIHAHPDPAWQQGLFDACAAMMLAIVKLPQPVIARVHGVAAAAGCQLVSMCDLAVTVPEARFALSGIHNGLFCSTPAVGVARNINRKRAMEMLVTGDLIDADTARAWGLVNRVVPAEALDTEIAKLTDAIKANSGAAIALGKDAFYRQIDMGLTDAYDLAGRTMTCNLQDADGVEGVDAFVSKRKAVWKTKRA